MLSSSIYKLVATMDRECTDGVAISPAMQRTLIDCMYGWHKIALDLEVKSEDLEAIINAMGGQAVRRASNGDTTEFHSGDAGWVPMIVGGTDLDQADE